MNKISKRIAAISVLLLGGCLGGGDEIETPITVYFSGPLSKDSKQVKIDESFRRFLTPLSKQDVCNGDIFAPVVRFARLDSDNVSVLEGGKLSGLTKSNGVDAMLGNKADPLQTGKAVDEAIELWNLNEKLYLASKLKILTVDYSKIIERDKLGVVILISENATSSANAAQVIKASLGKNAPTVLEFGISDGAGYTQKTLLELCNRREKSATEKVNLGLFFVSDSASSRSGAAKQIPAIQNDITKKPLVASTIHTNKAGVVAAKKPTEAAKTPLSTPAPTVTQSPPPVAPQVAAPATQQIAPSRQATARELCQQTDRNFIGQSLCETRICERDPAHIDTSYCRALREKRSSTSSNY